MIASEEEEEEKTTKFKDYRSKEQDDTMEFIFCMFLVFIEIKFEN